MKRVLIIEDNPVHRRLMENELQREYELVFAADSQTALACLSESRFDLVVLDLNIPKRVGEAPNSDEAMDILRYHRRSLPVAIVSGGVTENLRVKMESLGVVKIFAKPFSLAEFREFVDEILKS